MLGVTLGDFHLVGYGFGMRIAESQHAYVHLYRRLVVQEHDESRRKANVEREVPLESTREVLA